MEKINTKIWLKIDIKELEDRKEFAMVLPPVSVVANTVGQKTIACIDYSLCIWKGHPCSGLSLCVALGPGGSCGALFTSLD